MMQIFNIIARTEKLLVGESGIKMPSLTAGDVLTSVLNITYFAAGLVAVIVIIIAGYNFTTAVYDQAKITQAKNAILYAVVGLIAVVMAFVITNFIIGRF